MLLNWIDRMGDLNPQLLRELKGRFNGRNVAIAVVVSIVGQLLTALSWLRGIPDENYSAWAPYCKLRSTYEAYQQQQYRLQDQYRQLQQQFNHYSGSKDYNPEKIQQLKAGIDHVKERLTEINIFLKGSTCPFNEIDFSRWWQDQYRSMFIWLSVLGLFALLVIGTYMLISDLGHEERRGTLNFIRLSPQSTRSFWLGKMLGVPVLLYLAALLTIPLHLWSGLSAQIPLIEILSFWAILAASCAFFFSAALLFGLFGSWFSGFQAWLGSGIVLIFLLVANFKPIDHSPMDWMNLFNPSILLTYLIDQTGSQYMNYPLQYGKINGLEFFNFPVGTYGLAVTLLALLNYSLWTYWIGQALNRQFHNPSATLLSKRQSYILTACWTIFALGFALQAPREGYSSQVFYNLNSLLALNLILFLGLIAALSPHRQILQDWARYRHQGHSHRKGGRNALLVWDLLWGERSPSVIAIAINLSISALPILAWILLWPIEIGGDGDSSIQGILSLMFSVSMLLIYALIAQLMLLMKTRKRAIWATGTLIGIISLPPIGLGVLSIQPGQDWGGLWLLTAFPWDHVMRYVSVPLVMQALLVQISILAVLNWQLTRQLRQAGESASKMLLTGHSGGLKR